MTQAEVVSVFRSTATGFCSIMSKFRSTKPICVSVFRSKEKSAHVYFVMAKMSAYDGTRPRVDFLPYDVTLNGFKGQLSGSGRAENTKDSLF